MIEFFYEIWHTHWIWDDYTISILNDKCYSYNFTKNPWMKIFSQTTISVWKLKKLLKYYSHLKGKNNCVGGFVSKFQTTFFKMIIEKKIKSASEIT